jgi:hypothetical protein
VWKLNNKQVRSRGAQPGNQNAKGNRGNPNPRRNYSNRGGAPRGNHNACKKPQTLLVTLLQEYRHLHEAEAWIKAHAHKLRNVVCHAEDARDRALYDGARGLTPDLIDAKGLEFRLGLYSSPVDDYEHDGAT